MGRWVLAGSHNGERVPVGRRNVERGTGGEITMQWGERYWWGDIVARQVLVGR